MTETLSKFFVKAADKLNIKELKNISNTDGFSDPVEIAIKKYENHQSITAITEKFNFTVCFVFDEVNLKDTEKEILNLKVLHQIAFWLKYFKKLLTSAALCFSRNGMMEF